MVKTDIEFATLYAALLLRLRNPREADFVLSWRLQVRGSSYYSTTPYYPLLPLSTPYYPLVATTLLPLTAGWRLRRAARAAHRARAGCRGGAERARRPGNRRGGGSRQHAAPLAGPRGWHRRRRSRQLSPGAGRGGDRVGGRSGDPDRQRGGRPALPRGRRHLQRRQGRRARSGQLTRGRRARARALHTLCAPRGSVLGRVRAGLVFRCPHFVGK